MADFINERLEYISIGPLVVGHTLKDQYIFHVKSFRLMYILIIYFNLIIRYTSCPNQPKTFLKLS